MRPWRFCTKTCPFVRFFLRPRFFVCGGLHRQKTLGEAGLWNAGGFTQGDAHALPFPDGFFDIVVSCETIEHLPEPLRGVQEFYRVTRPGGLLFLTTPNYLNFMGLYEIYAKFRHPGILQDQPFDRIQVFFQTRRLLKKTGWKILRSDGGASISVFARTKPRCESTGPKHFPSYASL